MSAQHDTQPSAATLAAQQEQLASATSRRAFLRRLSVGGGLALGVGVLLHVLLHWKWLVRKTQRLLGL